jgi:excisionase family DNA binding protein
MQESSDNHIRATTNLPEVAAVLGCSRSSVYRWAANGTLPTIRLGRRVVVPKAAVDAMLCPAPSRTAQPMRAPKSRRGSGESSTSAKSSHAPGGLRE